MITNCRAIKPTPTTLFEASLARLASCPTVGIRFNHLSTKFKLRILLLKEVRFKNYQNQNLIHQNFHHSYHPSATTHSSMQLIPKTPEDKLYIFLSV